MEGNNREVKKKNRQEGIAAKRGVDEKGKSCSKTCRTRTKRLPSSSLYFHGFDAFAIGIRLVAAFLFDPDDEVVDGAGPGTVGAPPGQSLVVASLAHEHLGLLPQVLVDGPLAAGIQEVEEPVEPRRGGGVPWHAAVGVAEEQLPLVRGDLEGEVALTL
jgi:hypothetical protein